MSVYFALDEGEPVFLASVSGWGAFRHWTESLEQDTVSDLLHLVDYGWDEDCPQTAAQLQQALLEQPPETDVATIAQSLLAALANAGDAVLTITDGLGPQEDAHA